MEAKENFDVRLSRFNLGVRGLFHYGNSETMDMYSGTAGWVEQLVAGCRYERPQLLTSESQFTCLRTPTHPLWHQGYFTEHLGIGESWTQARRMWCLWGCIIASNILT